MQFRSIAPAILIATAATAPLAAQEVARVGSLTVSTPWTRETAPGQKVGGGFMIVGNRGTAPDRLIAATTPVAARVELHTMSMAGGVMRMREVKDGLPVPARGKLELKPGGYHLMLMGLKTPLKRGSTVPITLRFERAGDVTVRLKVEAIGYGSAPKNGGHHAH